MLPGPAALPPIPAPTSYQDIVFPSDKVEQLVNNLVTNSILFPANGKTGFLIHGPYGTGKTTLAEQLPDSMILTRGGSPRAYRQFYSVMTGTNGAGFIARLANSVSLVPTSGNYHYVILDEVDNLGPAAMKSLKGVMSNPIAIFIMTTNNLDAIDPGVRSRSHEIDMTIPPPYRWLPKAQRILTGLGVTKTVPNKALEAVIASCNGDVRKLLTELQKIALALR